MLYYYGTYLDGEKHYSDNYYIYTLSCCFPFDNNGGIKEDLMKNRFDIKNVLKWKGWGQDDVCDDLDEGDDEIEFDTYEEWLKQ